MPTISRTGHAPTWSPDEALRFLDAVVDQLPAMVFIKSAAQLRFVGFNRAGEELLNRIKAGDLYTH